MCDPGVETADMDSEERGVECEAGVVVVVAVVEVVVARASDAAMDGGRWSRVRPGGSPWRSDVNPGGSEGGSVGGNVGGRLCRVANDGTGEDEADEAVDEAVDAMMDEALSWSRDDSLAAATGSRLDNREAIVDDALLLVAVLLLPVMEVEPGRPGRPVSGS